MSKFGQVNSEVEFVVIPIPPSDVTKFLRGDNTWDIPAGGAAAGDIDGGAADTTYLPADDLDGGGA